MKVFLDLCSGLGGASEAFVQDPNWRAIRIENNPELAHVPWSHCLDVLKWEEWIDDVVPVNTELVVWASPPCLEFSQAYAAPGPTAEREGREWKPNTDILEACRDIIEYLQPSWYVIENVMGAVRYFPDLLGPYAQHIGPFYLWGKFPQITMPRDYSHSKADQDTWSDDPLRSNKLACIPFEISFQFLKTLNEQRTLDWYA